MKLNLTNFSKSIDALELMYNESNKIIKGPIESVMEIICRSAVIKGFELTYELSWKSIQRYIQIKKDNTEDSPRSRKELFQEALKCKIFDSEAEIDLWIHYNDLRNMTTHVYEEAEANQVYSESEQFLKDAKKLLAKLRDLNE